jgi:hypothetical protein
LRRRDTLRTLAHLSDGFQHKELDLVRKFEPTQLPDRYQGTTGFVMLTSVVSLNGLALMT